MKVSYWVRVFDATSVIPNPMGYISMMVWRTSQDGRRGKDEGTELYRVVTGESEHDVDEKLKLLQRVTRLT